jgi:2-keto-3-deoxy-6-phosphogluconate aldolase
MPCGGISPENAKEYFAYGASAVAFGSNVFKDVWLASRDFKSISDKIKEYLP